MIFNSLSQRTLKSNHHFFTLTACVDRRVEQRRSAWAKWITTGTKGLTRSSWYEFNHLPTSTSSTTFRV